MGFSSKARADGFIHARYFTELLISNHNEIVLISFVFTYVTDRPQFGGPPTYFKTQWLRNEQGILVNIGRKTDKMSISWGKTSEWEIYFPRYVLQSLSVCKQA